MKIFPFKIPKPKEEALIFQEDRGLAFYDKLHQHEEIQISYIVQGEGTILVGDTMSSFQKGSIIVIGSNLPHVFKSDTHTDINSHMLTIFFDENSFGNHFFDLPEFKNLNSFFTSIKNGFKIDNAPKSTVNLFLKFKNAFEFDRFLLFLKLLNSLSQSEKQLLSSFIYEKQFTDTEGKRMQSVLDYVINNYHKEITLDEIASIANMTKNAFCRYFKVRTNKTFFQFLIDIRIESASKLLLKNNELSVIEIAELCGFNNISNFNRKFKEIKLASPLKYKQLNI